MVVWFPGVSLALMVQPWTTSDLSVSLAWYAFSVFKSFVLWVQIILSNLFYSSWLLGKIQLEACTRANDDLENDTSNVLSQCRLKIQCNFSLNYITIISDA